MGLHKCPGPGRARRAGGRLLGAWQGTVLSPEELQGSEQQQDGGDQALLVLASALAPRQQCLPKMHTALSEEIVCWASPVTVCRSTEIAQIDR